MRTLVFSALAVVILVTSQPIWAMTCAELFLSVNEARNNTLEQVFSASEQLLAVGRRAHQDQVVNADSLSIGEVLWVSKGHLRGLYPSSRSALGNVEEIQKVTIANLDKNRRWKGERAVTVESEILGQLAIPVSQLPYFYRRPDFQQRAPFLENEWVQIGTRDDPIIDRRTGEIFTRNLKLGKFLGMEADGNYLIKMTQYGPNYIIPARYVYGLNTGTKRAFDDAINPFLSLEYSFREGDVALARLTNGEVTEVLIEKTLSDGRYSVSIPNGRLFDVRGAVLSKIVGHKNPRTWTHRVNGQVTEEKIHGTELGDFFDGARKMVSHPDFSSKSDLKKLELIVRYVNRFFKEDHEVAYDYTKDPTDKLLCVGVAVCNHKAYVVANILSEAGFGSSVGVAYRKKDGAGHAWAIARMPNGQTYYVDPGKWYDILPIWQARKRASEIPESLAAEFYRNPERKVYNLR